MGFKEPERNLSPAVTVTRTSSILNRVTGGLQELYKNLDPKQRRVSATRRHVEGSCTAKDGCFVPDKAPLLAHRYHIVEIIGKGSFGVIVQAVDTFYPDRSHVAIKVFDLANTHLGYQEANYTRLLNQADPHDCVHIIRLLNMFFFDQHMCLVYELMSSLHLCHKLEVIPRTADYKQKKLKMIRKITLQLLVVLQFLSRTNIIHADLKPENILPVKSTGSGCALKVIDFGNAFHCTASEIEPYLETFDVQSLWYRAPEVLLGVGISLAIDMWSVGCILAELFIGRPLFVGQTREEVMKIVIALLGDLPRVPFMEGKFSASAGQHCTSSTCSQVTVWHQTGERLYTVFSKISKAGQEEREFASFLGTLLCYEPDLRATPSEALKHPFLRSILPQRYLTESSGTYRLLNQFARPPQIQSELMQRLGVGSLLRLTSLSPMKQEFKDRQVVKESTERLSHYTNRSETRVSSSPVMSPPHTEVMSSSQVESRSTHVDNLNEKPDPIENCDICCEDSDDVMLIELEEQLPTGSAKLRLAQEQGSDVLHIDKGYVPHCPKKRKKYSVCPKLKAYQKRVRRAVDPCSRRKSFSRKQKAVLSEARVVSCSNDHEEKCLNTTSDGECDVVQF